MKIHNPKKKWAAMTERERRASLARTWDDLAAFYEKERKTWRPFTEWLQYRMDNIARHYGVDLSNGGIVLSVTTKVRLYRNHNKKPLPKGVIKGFDWLANWLFAQDIYPCRRIERRYNCVAWEFSPSWTINPKTKKLEPFPSNPWKEKKPNKQIKEAK